MCVSGKPIKAPEALAAGLIDAIDRRRSRARCGRRSRATARSPAAAKTRDRTDRLGTPDDERAAASTAARAAGRQGSGAIRPRRSTRSTAIEAAATLPFEDGCRRERELFIECVQHRAGEGADPCLLRRARRGQDCATCQPTSRPRQSQRVGDHRRRHDGRRHRHGLRERRHRRHDRGHDAGRRSIAAWPRIRRNYDIVGEAGPLHGRRRSANGIARDHAAARLRRLRRGRPDDRSGVREHGAQEGDLRASSTPWPGPDACWRRNTSTLDIDAIAAATSRPETRRRAALLQPGERHAAGRNRARRRRPARDDSPPALAFAKRLGEGRRRRRQLPGLRRQPHDVPLHVRGAVPRRGGRDARAGGPRADRLRHGDGHLRRRRHGRTRRRLARAAGARSTSPSPACAGRSSPTAERDGALRAEDRQAAGTSTTISARPTPDPEVVRSDPRDGDATRASRSAPSPTRRSSSAASTRSSTKARASSRKAFALRASDIDVIYLNGYGFPAWRGGPMFYADRIGLRADPRPHRGAPSRARRSLGARAAARRRLAPRRRHVPRLDRARRCRLTMASPRPVRRSVDRRRRAPDGTQAATCARRVPLGPYPAKLTERLEHWAAHAPDRTFLARA